ncbi:unnamed protein product [Coffea canephora]|uniref:MATH domain-containing protein n=1 Tax=Coffea canephora TaxID=49390 RepID=A0A068V516_COFCA|nr:unnamed protein product [Coffea canephora]
MRPAHYTLKIDSFSSFVEMLKKTGSNSYKSETFEACGHKWKLSLYPNGDKERNGAGYLSLFFILQETSDLPLGWEINANFKFFVFDQVRDKYLTIQDAGEKVRRFNEMNKEWGIARLLSQYVFNDAKRGYLVQDKCMFGVEIFHSIHMESKCFSTLSNETYSSDEFAMGSYKWKLLFYPKGDCTQEGRRNVSIFLTLADVKTAARVHAEFTLSIKNQKDKEHKKLTGNQFFSTSTPIWGWSAFLPVDDLEDSAKGFLVQDTLIIEAEINPLSTLKCLT